VHTHGRTPDARWSVGVGVAFSGLALLLDWDAGVELDPHVLVANPLLWHLLDAGARRSAELGTLRRGSGLLRELAERIDDAAARELFRNSGLQWAGPVPGSRGRATDLTSPSAPYDTAAVRPPAWL
jgi:hypothetical protein